MSNVLLLALTLTLVGGAFALVKAESPAEAQRFNLPVFLAAQADTIPVLNSAAIPGRGGVRTQAMESAGVSFEIPVERAELSFSLNRLVIPVAGVDRDDLDDSFYARRSGGRTHQAIDIAAELGTPVVAVSDGSVIRKHSNRLGGRVLYTESPDGRYAFYYAHLDGYAPGIEVGRTILQGDTLGYVGNSGNARNTVPHLHFQVIETGGRSASQLYRGRKLNPYSLLRNSGFYENRMTRARS